MAAMSGHLSADVGAFADAHLEENGTVEEEKPAMDYIYISDNKLKYINKKYEKVNAKMYDYKCDVRLMVGDENFKGHKKVLADASDYFAAMFRHQMREKDETEIRLKDISPAGCTAMLDYFYHGNVTVDAGNIPDVLEAARFFHVDWILEISCDFLVRHLSFLDYNLTLQLADKFALGDLRWDIFKFFGHNLPTLIENETFYQNVSAELLQQFLMEYMYVEVSEFFLLQMILNWVKVDEGSRKQQLLPLLRQLRFPTMDLEELEALPKEVLEFREIRDEIEEAKTYCLDIPNQCLKTEDRFFTRGSRDTVILLSFNQRTDINTVMYKDPENEDSNIFIENLGESGMGIDYSTSNQASIGNFLFSTGGHNLQYMSSAQVFRYDPRYREWTEIASMNQARVSFAMCSSKNRLYVFGGVHQTVGELDDAVDNILSSVEMYNPEENAWRNLAKLPYGCFDQAATCYGNTLYMCGGISDHPDHSVPISFAHALTDGADEWTPLPDMLTARLGHSMTPHNGKLYILGGNMRRPHVQGFSECHSNEAFDIETNQWTAILSTPEVFRSLNRHVGFVDNKIYFLCRIDSDPFLCSYDVDTDSIEECAVVATDMQKISVVKVAYPHT